MEILINGIPAVMKSGSSFQYISENRAFTEAEGYSLSISFPLRDCPENVRIFGHVYRADAIINQSMTYSCEIRDKAIVKYGTLTILDISPEEVKGQFLEGASAANNNINLETAYVNELNLGSPADTTPPNPPYLAWQPSGAYKDYVALPWCNNNDGTVHNGLTVAEDGSYQWDEGVTSLSYFPYLIFIAKKICEAIGYSYDFLAWESKEEIRYLLICNTLPETWQSEFRNCLPHWTVSEFFAKVGQFLQGEFSFDEHAKRITFSLIADVVPSTIVPITDVLDSFESSSSEDDELEIPDACNIAYKEQSNPMWKYYRCPSFIEARKQGAYTFLTLQKLLDTLKDWRRMPNASYRGGTYNYNGLFYAADFDMYVAMRGIRLEEEKTSEDHSRYMRVTVVQPLNMFGDRIVNENSDNNLEIEVAPAWLDYIEGKGLAIFQNITAETDVNVEGYVPGASIKDQLPRRDEIIQSWTLQALEQQTDSETPEYFSSLPVAWWDGAPAAGKIPCPVIDTVTIYEDWTYSVSHTSLRLTGYRNYYEGYEIQRGKMYSFTFISDTIPDVRSIFTIHNQLYVCKKITATITETGLSQLMKGEFYRIRKL